MKEKLADLLLWIGKRLHHLAYYIDTTRPLYKPNGKINLDAFEEIDSSKLNVED